MRSSAAAFLSNNNNNNTNFSSLIEKPIQKTIPFKRQKTLFETKNKKEENNFTEENDFIEQKTTNVNHNNNSEFTSNTARPLMIGYLMRHVYQLNPTVLKNNHKNKKLKTERVGEGSFLVDGFPLRSVQLCGRVLYHQSAVDLFHSLQNKNNSNNNSKSNAAMMRRPYSVLILSDTTGMMGVIQYHNFRDDDDHHNNENNNNHHNGYLNRIAEEELDIQVNDYVRVTGRLCLSDVDPSVMEFFQQLPPPSTFITSPKQNKKRIHHHHHEEERPAALAKGMVMLPGAEAPVHEDVLRSMGISFQNNNNHNNESEEESEIIESKHYQDTTITVSSAAEEEMPIIPLKDEIRVCVKSHSVQLLNSINETHYHWLNTMLVHQRLVHKTE